MKKTYITAEEILRGTGINIVNAAILIRLIVNSKYKPISESNFTYCKRIIELGERNFSTLPQKRLGEAFKEYVASKTNLKQASLRDITKLGNRIFRINPNLRNRYISGMKRSELECILEKTFLTPSQFNKGRMMLHGFFNFALRREYCEKNPVSLIAKKRVVEREITPLSMAQIKSLCSATETGIDRGCAAPFSLMLYAGIRPQEVRRLRWRDIDLRENVITIAAHNSKTGGTRHITILPILKRTLTRHRKDDDAPITPPNWGKKWREIRIIAGLKDNWQQDVLRHTYASYHAKYFKNLPQLQLEMGHRDLALLRSRYVNMRGISKKDAREFFRGH